MKSEYFAVFAVVISLASAWALAKDVNPSTVDSVDVNRYMGTWYEIARKPMFFQRQCAASRAEYQLRTDGKIDVINTCVLKKDPTRTKQAKGLAHVAGDKSNAKLKVSFSPILKSLFKADYWIVELDPDYGWAVVSNRKGNYLWILSRTPELTEGVYEHLLGRLEKKGFDLSDVRKSPVWEEDTEN